MLRVGHLAGVEPAVDVDERAALVGERAGIVVGEAAGVRQPQCDRAVPLEVGEVSALEMSAMYTGRPNELRPTSCSSRRSVAASSRSK